MVDRSQSPRKPLAFFPSLLQLSVTFLYLLSFRHVRAADEHFTVPPDAQNRNVSFQSNNPKSIPNFLFIGTAKGGTTDLFYQIAHSSLRHDPDRTEVTVINTRKEVSFLQHIPVGKANVLDSGHFQTYLHKLNHSCAGKTREPLRKCLEGPLRHFTIDGSPQYEQFHQVPVVLKSFSPLTKVIMLLRDPMERVESLYYHFLVQNKWNHNLPLKRLANEFIDELETLPGLLQAMERLAACTSPGCQIEAWGEAVALGLRTNSVVASGLYIYTLAAWREHFFQPGRAMVIDSHVYFRNRSEVMEQVVWFLYGRPMTAAERTVAQSGYVHNVKRIRRSSDADGLPARHWQLSGPARVRLASLYATHVMRRLPAMLQELRKRGVVTVGFGGPPWPQNEEQLAAWLAAQGAKQEEPAARLENAELGAEALAEFFSVGKL